MLGTARFVREPTDLIIITFPEPSHPAVLAMFAPQVHIDMPVTAERSHELVSMLIRPQREFLGARKIEPNALEHMRQLGHEKPPETPSIQSYPAHVTAGL